jgi:hypothetical protein
MWKEAVAAYFEVLSLHSRAGTEENHKVFQNIRYFRRDSNRGLP